MPPVDRCVVCGGLIPPRRPGESKARYATRKTCGTTCAREHSKRQLGYRHNPRQRGLRRRI